MLLFAILAVCVLPIQMWTDAMPKFGSGINFQNVLTLILLVGWKISTARQGRKMLSPSEPNKWLGLYLGWSFLALFYGVLFAPVDLPLSMSNERFIHWKDEATGLFMFFIVANCLKDEKAIKRLLFCMCLLTPYIINVYYKQYHAPTSLKTAQLQPDEVVLDDDIGNNTGHPFAPYFKLDDKPLFDDEHSMSVTDWEGRKYEVQPTSYNPRVVRIFGYDRRSGRVLNVKFHQDRGSGAAAAQEFSWDLKEITGVFTQIGSNEMAAFYANAFLFMVGMLVCYRSVGWRIYLLFNMALLGWGLIFSLSRGAWLAICAGVGYLGARKSKGLMIAFVGFIFLAPALMPGSVTSRASGGMDDSAAHRLDFWKWAAVAGTIRFPLGVGYQCYIPRHQEETGIKLDTHNFFFRTLAEMGLVGLALVILLLRAAFRTGWKLYVEGKNGFQRGVGLGAALLVIGNAVSNMFGDRFSYVSLGCFMWAFIGMAARLNTINAAAAKEEAERNKARPSATPSHEMVPSAAARLGAPT